MTKVPDIVLMLDKILERLTVLRENALQNPDYFSITYSIDRGLEYNFDLGRVCQKNPEITKIEVQEFHD